MPMTRTTSERESYTYLQQRKRCKFNRSQDLQYTSLLPSTIDADENSTKQTQWKGWKSLSNESSPQTNKENNEFPPLTNGNIFDSWFTPEPIKNWADFMDIEESQANKKPDFDKKQRFKRKLLLSDRSEKANVTTKVDKPILTDEHRLAQRQKQIDFGKNTAAYGRYITEKPRHCRGLEDPKTPDKFQNCSTRSWTGQVRCWRRKLHEWDPPTGEKDDIFALVSKSNAQEDDVISDMKSSALSTQSEDFSKDLYGCLLQEKLCL